MDTVTILKEDIKESASPYHAGERAVRRLKDAGFCELKQSEPWTIERGGAYVVSCFGTSVVAFTVGSGFRAGGELRAAAAHLDSPCLRIKPSPETSAAGCCKLNIEPYGSMIYASWLDRPLSVAGAAAVRKGDHGVEKRLVDFRRPLLTIPQLAIHMNREVNRGTEWNANRDMPPILSTLEGGEATGGMMQKLLAEALAVDPDAILSYDLCVYNAEDGTRLGAKEELYSSPRLDNLTSVSAIVSAMIEGRNEKGKRIDEDNTLDLLVLYDHEEVGSKTKQGADSATLSMLLEKLTLALGFTRAEQIDLLMSGTMLSCDVAHAVHPNRSEMADPVCRAYLNRGVVLKMNHNQRYPTDAMGTGRVLSLCREKEIPTQIFYNRADLVGGSTIGSYASSQLGMTTIDCGVPLLAMHSARELMGASDQDALTKLVYAFFTADSLRV